MITTRETFDKTERLCSEKAISALFESGNIFHNSLLKVVWKPSSVQLPYPAQVAFSVPKRGFRLAVTRNLIKRRLREAYRKNKRLLYEHLVSQNSQVIFVIIMKGTVVPDYQAIEKSIKDVLSRMIAVTGKKEHIC